MIMMKTCIMPILIYYFNNVSLALLRANLLTKHEELPKKINKMLNGKHGDEVLLNVNEYEYPKTNKTLRQLHKQQWLNYYKCLKEIYADIKQDRITYPSALIALEGASVTLECQICISPLEMYTTSLIEWYFNSSSSSSSSSSKSSKVKNTLHNGNHIVNSPDNRYIIMYNVKLEQAGSYWCEVGHTVGSIYYLHVDSNMETVNVYPDRASYILQATLMKNVSEYKLKVYTTWTTWSSCSTCDAVGIKLRYGYCTVSLLEMSDHKSFINKRVSIMNKLQHMKRDIKKEQVRLIPAIKNKKIEIMKQYCKKKCRKDIIFEVRDKKGNILESANNSAGIFSMIQEMPEPLPSIARIVVYEKHNKNIKLVCPGNLNADVPIVWRIDDKTIIPSHIKSQSNGRIHINPQMQILFEPLKFEDTNIYSCWQNNEIAGIIKLIVIGEIEFKLNHHVILMGAIVVISVIFIMFWKAFKERMRYTMH
ncbi:PREDICTED: Ig-like V-type domain-containing protein FAM187A [Trachymyrmex cornetzi]|uniref:Ig-like V-type domain-containing protein FAM187A n=1 Tax=Trachymyrmex cornetzi TaxID=471704 RepID=UPI00084F2577|nr:PREDICTED: Ig-like V-type domain-containing protein FAM187A [Trachymyrmex cornetzi]